MTYREQFDSAMECKTQQDAAIWLGAEIERYEREFGKSHDEAKHIILSNLGYMAGYYDAATAKKVNELFGAVHPIFGACDYFAGR